MATVTERQAYQRLQDAFGIKAGDKVKVLRKAEDGEMGWPNSWVHSMNGRVGKEFIVECVGEDITLGGTGGLGFPFFVLEVIKRKSNIKVKLNNEYTAEIFPDGSVGVGCQTISKDMIAVFVDAWRKQVA